MYKSTNRFMNKMVSQGRKPNFPSTSKGPMRTIPVRKRKKLCATLDAVHAKSVEDQWRLYEEECKRLGIKPIPRRR